VEVAWNSPGATPATRKRIIRTLIEEIVVRVEEDALDLVIRWAGGDHTTLRVRKNRAGQHRWGTDVDVVELVTALARQLPDKAIAPILNRAGKTTGRGNGWTRSRVCFLRNHRGIPPYRDGERAERGEVTLEEAAKVLNVSEATVRRLIQEKILRATQHCKGAPWVIQAEALDDARVKQAADARRLRRPPSDDPRQNTLAL
jgi:excisionase family DNA binding protein